MDFKTCLFLGCVLLLVSTGLQGATTPDVDKSKRAETPKIGGVAREAEDLRTINRTSAKLAVSNRLDAETRRVNPFRLLMGRPRVSPLFLINGTVCRFVNSQPICTTLSTTGLSVGGSGGGASRPASSGGSGGGGGSASGGSASGGSGSRPSGGGGGAGGGSSGAAGGSGSRPSSSGLMSGGSSVQFANSPDSFVERLDNLTDATSPEQPANQAALRPLGVIMNPNRQRLGLFRRPMRYQLVTNRQEDITREEPNQSFKTVKSDN